MKKQSGCDFEPRVVEFLRSGTGGAEAAAHLKQCADCRDTAKIISFFRTNLPPETAPKNLPTAGLVWWKAKLREKRRAAEKAAQPIRVAQTAAAAAAVAAAAALLIYRPEFLSPLGAILSQTFDAVGQAAFPMFAGILIFAVASALTIFTLSRLSSDK